MANKMNSVDDNRMRIIDAFRRLQRGESVDGWYSYSTIANEAGIGFLQCAKGLVEMSWEGWLHIRHNPESPERLLYRLKSEYC